MFPLLGSLLSFSWTSFYFKPNLLTSCSVIFVTFSLKKSCFENRFYSRNALYGEAARYENIIGFSPTLHLTQIFHVPVIRSHVCNQYELHHFWWELAPKIPTALNPRCDVRAYFHLKGRNRWMLSCRNKKCDLWFQFTGTLFFCFDYIAPIDLRLVGFVG